MPGLLTEKSYHHIWNMGNDFFVYCSDGTAQKIVRMLASDLDQRVHRRTYLHEGDIVTVDPEGSRP